MRNIFSNRSGSYDTSHFKKLLVVGSAIAIVFANSVGAQEKSDNDGAGVIEEVVVTSTRNDLREAIEYKRASDVVSDSIVASDIGALPDVNIADSLQRVPGVQVQRNDRGQTAQITIRGLPANYTNVLYNGRPVSTGFLDSNGRFSDRNFQAFIMPSAFIQSLNVNKTAKADIFEGGIAGTVDVVSRKASDYGEQTFAYDLRASLESNSGERSDNFSGLYANMFADDKIGFLIGVNYTSENPDQHRSRGGPYNAFSNEQPGRDLNGDGDFTDTNIAVRRSVVYENFTQRRDRWSAVSTLEFFPSDNLSFKVDMLYSDQEVESQRLHTQFSVLNSDTVSSQQESVVIDGVEIVSRYASQGALVRPQGELQLRDFDLFVVQGEMSWDVADDWNVSLLAGYNTSENEEDRLRAIANGPTIPATITFSGGEDNPAGVELSDAARATYLDPASYSLRQFTSGAGLDNQNKLTQADVFLDVDYNLDRGFFKTVEFGGSYVKSELDSMRTAINLNAAELAGIGITSYNFIETGAAEGSFLGSANREVPQSFIVPDIIDILSQVTPDQLIAGDSAAVINDPSRFIELDEEFFAAYLQLSFENGDGTFSGNVGLRYARTEETVGGNSIDLSAGFTADPLDGSLTPIRVGSVTRSRHYDDWLPSINLRYNLGDDHVLRFAASKAITRPAPGDLGLVVGGLSAGSFGVGNMISFNDPNLDPFRSTNFDFSWSWYYAEEALFSLSLFQKDLNSLIGTVNFTQNFDVTDGGTGVTNSQQFVVSARSNDDGVKLKGFEVQLQQPFTFLPGFLKHTGIKANYTYIDNSAPRRLRAAAENNYNFVVYFDNGVFDARLSYTNRGEYLFQQALGGITTLHGDELVAEREFMVANITYNVNDSLQVFLNASNITDQPDNRFQGGGLVRQYQDHGRSIGGGIRGSF